MSKDLLQSEIDYYISTLNGTDGVDPTTTDFPQRFVESLECSNPGLYETIVDNLNGVPPQNFDDIYANTEE